MAKDTVEEIDQNNPILEDLAEFNAKIKEEIRNIEAHKMVKKDPKNIDLRKFIGFIETDEETDCMKDHDLIL